ncbi:MAG: PSD1 domain-containing protein [Phycisphaerales bacterium]|nr:PSD1 domain-containing protein [Phycisphaerales bacterium]
MRTFRFTPRRVAAAIGLGTLVVLVGFGRRPDAQPGPGIAAPTPAPVDFNTEIRPLLGRACLSCHGPDSAARQAGLRLDLASSATSTLESGRRAIVPGDPDAGALLGRVTASNPARRMPPPKTGLALTDAEIDRLRRWIAEGAAYDPHWAFVPPGRPTPPTVIGAAHPIDAFIRARLAEEGLAPSPEADRETLIRRVTLDLTGLPPTVEEVDAYLADVEPGAYERVVDRLLASPRYGERWASLWLDLARYADTKGYEADRRRTMWPYRDWVIRAFNDDMPFDRFTVEQIAGDLLPDPTTAQLVATAFHRNTMTNDEGGTDDEEFRVAAVIDRTNTTMQAWMGLSMGCAQCHTHKYDPITHDEYYSFYDFFNQSEDSDQMDDRPLQAAPTPEQTIALRDARATLDDAYRRLDDTIAAGPTTATDFGDARFRPRDEARDLLWIDDDVPAGATTDAPGGVDAWTWVGEDDGPVRSGARAIRLAAPGREVTQVYFNHARRHLDIDAGTRLFAHVHLDPEDPPAAIMLQWYSIQQGWSHRAYWGENAIDLGGVDGGPTRRRIGDLPPTGRWVRLEIDPADVGLTDLSVNGWAFTQAGGTVTWDAAGLTTTAPDDAPYVHDLDAWIARVNEGRWPDVPDDLRVAAAAGLPRTDAQRRALHRHFALMVSVDDLGPVLPLAESVRAAEARIASIETSVPMLPIMRERPEPDRRATHVHQRGNYRDPGARVTADVPAALSAFRPEWPRDRLGLASWLTSRDNPLTARVFVNRIWEAMFGIGLVETAEDFGVQGTPPSHPRLLDWLATDFMDHDWRVKALCRRIVTSATYQQSSDVRDGDLEHDAYNRLLARGPRFRLPAEMVRDQALAAAGLLAPTMYGPPVFPPQPDGVWMVVYSDDHWATDVDADRFRRGVYTFWRRTSPYPSMTTFDAPSREFCVSRRLRTNTPLQALVLLNDPVYIEAAGGLALRMLDGSDLDDDARIACGVRRCVARAPSEAETAMLVDLLSDARQALAAAPDQAGALLREARVDVPPDDATTVERASWVVVANVLLNLDEMLVKR